MAGIVGLAGKNRQIDVDKMLQKILHRGKAGHKIKTGERITLGAVWPKAQAAETAPGLPKKAVWDTHTPPLPVPQNLQQTDRPFALAAESAGGAFLARDPFGVRPLYFGYTSDRSLAFASEVKALLEVTRDVNEFPPGYWYEGRAGLQAYREVSIEPYEPHSVEQAAEELRRRLERAISHRSLGEETGSWLSGGLDSSIIAALARPHVRTLHTFAGGLAGAPDLEFARQVAEDLDCRHHEVLLTERDLVAALPDVIYYLESFDALLVRSTIVNYLVARHAAEWIGEVLSGEGADELFGGYAYLETVSNEGLAEELLDITRRLHNTALQRVDRSASAHGLVPHVPFLDLEVASYALGLPAELKRGPQEAQMEKWILRKALEGRLPESVLWRRKAKFWEGAGVGDILSQQAEAVISDRDFASGRKLPNGAELNTKEEWMYYRFFKEHFGEFDDLSWMGRTKGAPRQEPAVGRSQGSSGRGAGGQGEGSA